MTGAVHSGSGSTSGPLRTCVGCRQRAASSDLIRIVVSSGALVPDPTRRLPGRGASLHPTEQCLERAEKRRAFPRALRVAGPVDLAALRDYIGRAASRIGSAQADR